jgi:hypothetical protein
MVHTHLAGDAFARDRPRFEEAELLRGRQVEHVKARLVTFRELDGE